MDYELQQRGRASIDFLCDLRSISDRYEPVTDQRALTTVNTDTLPDEPEQLQSTLAPVLESDPEFRLLRMCRDWTLEKHGGIAMECLVGCKGHFSVDIVCAKIVGPNPDEEFKIRYVDVRAGVAAALTRAPDAFAVREWVRGAAVATSQATT